MHKRPEISVIMGIYNQWDKSIMIEAVQSILHQTFEDFEFIIYDDGSDVWAGANIRDLGKLDSRIRIIGQEENHGLAFSLNVCIGKARGKYIARMDADDISLPNRLQVQYDFMESHPEYGWCGCNTEVFDNRGTWGIRKMPQTPELEDYLKYSPYVHPTVMYRAEIFEKEEKYHVSAETLRCEDYEIFMRLRQNGYRGYNIQKVLFRYREDQAAYKRRAFKYRINEAHIRYVNFKKMGILFPKGWLYVLRPLIGGLVPRRLIAWFKHKESGVRYGENKQRIETTENTAVSGTIVGAPGLSDGHL